MVLSAALYLPAPPGEPVVLGPSARPLAGFWHAPAPGRERNVAVVLCNPLGHEAMSVHRTYRHLAAALAQRGFGALRYDHDGTGDSAGEAGDPDRVPAWLEGVRAACEDARARAGVDRVVLCGTRFGACLAMQAAAEMGGVEGLVLWAPLSSGRAAARELRAYRLLRPAGAGAAPAGAGEEVAGYWFPAEALREMEAVDPLRQGTRLARRALVLPRTERAADEARLAEQLRALGGEVQLVKDDGYGRMMRDDPYDSVVPAASLDAIVAWVDAGPYGAPPRAAAAPESTPQALAWGGIIETPALIGRARRLFGVVSRPAAAAVERPAVCLLNAGANSHVGPHRMNVALGRKLAALGYVTLRLDAPGLGESPAAPGDRENPIYNREAVADVAAAMTWLGDELAVRRFVLVGLCSGAYLAYHAALQDPRVAGQVLLSSYAFEWKEGDSVTPTFRKPYRSSRAYARELLDRRVWERALRGEVDVRGIAGTLLERGLARVTAELPRWASRLRGRARPHNAVERDFQALCDRGVRSLLVSSFDDGGLDMIANYLGNDARRMRARPEFELRVVDGTDHTFTTLAAQRRLEGVIAGYLERWFP